MNYNNLMNSDILNINSNNYQIYKENCENSILKIFNISMYLETDNLNYLYIDYDNIYIYDRKVYVALMFYLRNIRIKDGIPKGRGMRYISYTMALWLLKYDPNLFDKNIYLFVSSIGCYKDCLLMARMAKNNNYTKQEINKILKPMAVSLIEDDYSIVKSFIDKSPVVNISLASKWAPREGKSYSDFIPHLHRLCKLNKKQPKESWRKLLRNIINKSPNPITIETLLSEKKYNDIDFSKIPVRAFKLYKNHFNTNILLRDKFKKFSIDNIFNTKTAYKQILAKAYILQYLNNKFELNPDNPIKLDEVAEMQWLNYMSNIKINQSKYNFIPMIDISASMFMYDSNYISSALTLGILLSQLSTDFMKNKAITFSDKPHMYNITGDTLCEKVNCIFKEIKNNCGNEYSTDFISAFECILEYSKIHNISNYELLKTKIIVFTDMDFDKCCNKNQLGDRLVLIKNKFSESGYTDLPQLILWNLTGSFSVSDILENNIIYVSGSDISIINDFLSMDIINTSSWIFNIIKRYFQLVFI